MPISSCDPYCLSGPLMSRMARTEVVFVAPETDEDEDEDGDEEQLLSAAAAAHATAIGMRRNFARLFATTEYLQ